MTRSHWIERLGTIAVGLAVGVAGWGGVALPASADAVEARYETLLRAVCLNDWEGAIALLGPLIAAPEITEDYRQSLVMLRDQLDAYRIEGTVIPDIDNCEVVLRRYVAASEVPGEPLDWQGAVAAVLNNDPITYADRQREARVAADLDQVEVVDISSLTPAQSIDLSSGSGVSAGTISNQQQVYTFFAGLGDRITLDVDVTRILPGSVFGDDDTQLFLFDASGRLIAENDDADGLQSRLEDVLLPRTGRYYAVVTTYNNDPLLDAEDRIEGWSEDGGSALEYTLTVSGATPTDELILTNYGEESE